MENPKKITNAKVEAIGDGLGVFDPQQGKSYVLNASTALVWQHCNGRTTTQQLTERLQQQLNMPHEQAESAMWFALGELDKANLLHSSVAHQPTYTRRQMLGSFAAAGLSVVLMPIVSQVMVEAAPTSSSSEVIVAPINPVEVDTSITVSASFDDAVDSGTWDWGDGSTSSATISGSAVGPDTHTYDTPGVYTIQLDVSDASGTATFLHEYVVAYASEDAFVTGGGWINSPAGAYADNTSLTGKANFGLNSKYEEGENTPHGQTQFNFKAANLKFHSSNYELLTVVYHKAMYRGTGTINGSGNYGFLVSVIDEALTPYTSVDRFRIKIWDKDYANAVVYDTQMGNDDDADPTTAIGGGNIKIHGSTPQPTTTAPPTTTASPTTTAPPGPP